jgi:hypothetical protein
VNYTKFNRRKLDGTQYIAGQQLRNTAGQQLRNTEGLVMFTFVLQSKSLKIAQL